MMLKAVFWDMDGTLIDSEPYWHAGEMQIAHEMWRARSRSTGARCRWRRSAGA